MRLAQKRYTYSGKKSREDYEYDNIGNIKIQAFYYDNGEEEFPYTYAQYNYDEANRLKTETYNVFNMGITPYTASCSYDDFGNIETVQRTASSGSVTTNTYSYGNTQWYDLLTAYNGHTITDDGIGNPLSYYNGRDYSFMWEDGRRLHHSSVGGQTSLYSYNTDGIRTEKAVTGKYTDRYILDGATVVGMERTKNGATAPDRYYFTYDENGYVSTVTCYAAGSGTPVRYEYVTNAQGDVRQIIDSSGAVVAYYAYDAWGKPLAILDGSSSNAITDENHIALINPFRYRSYIYDSETGFYYLQSRYYDPQIGRFINADGYVSSDGSAASMNMFSYCFNNPIHYTDDYGADPVPAWAKRIINGEATESDYLTALSVNPDSWAGSASVPVNKAIEIARSEDNNTSLHSKQKPNMIPRKDKRKGSEKRQPTGDRERNIGHPDGEEHSRVPKGNRGIHRVTLTLELIVVSASIAVLLFDDVTIAGIADDVMIAPQSVLLWDIATKLCK